MLILFSLSLRSGENRVNGTGSAQANSKSQTQSANSSRGDMSDLMLAKETLFYKTSPARGDDYFWATNRICRRIQRGEFLTTLFSANVLTTRQFSKKTRRR